MYIKKLSASFVTLVLFTGALSFAASESAQAKKIGDAPKEVTVDCGAGDTVSGAIASAKSGEDLTITVIGNCEEDVEIVLDDLTLRGDDQVGGTITGEVFVNAARRIRILDIAVTGGGNGVKASGGAFVSIENSDLSGNSANGLDVQGAHVDIVDNLFQGNGGCGVSVANSASVSSSGGNIIGDTTLDDTNGQCGVNVFSGGVYRETVGTGDTIAQNGSNFALEIVSNAMVELNQSTVDGTATGTQTSALVARVSTLVASADVVFNGFVTATDNAVVVINEDAVIDFGSLGCFNGAVAGGFSSIQCP